MANYVSSLTGQQINDVMAQIDQGVPEGWAVGEKNGVPVSSSSVYYHNNAKYYAESAQGSAARAEAAVPPSTAGAVFFDRSQSLTDAQKGQVQKNIGAGNNNPNLIDNPFFTVNNRHFTSIANPSGNQYTADRWFVSASNTGFTATWSENGITLANASTGSAYLQQRIAKLLDSAVGKPLTMSVMLANGQVYSATRASIPARSSSSSNIISSAVVTGLTLRFVYGSTTDTSDTAQLIVSLSNTFSVRAVKVEIGASSTLANDDRPNYNEELIRCLSADVVPTDYFSNKIVTATSNPNLFDNPFFTVNQRILTTGTVSAQTYIRDRWKLARCTYTFNNNGAVKTEWDGTGTGAYLNQYMQLENVNILAGQYVTISAYVDHTLYSLTLRIPTTSGVSIGGTLGGGVTINMTNQSGASRGVEVQFIHSKTAGLLIGPVKCEMGTVSTLYLDAPPNYTVELLKCQRYFQRIYGQTNNTIGVGHIYNNTARFMIPLGVPMRGTPTLAVQGTYNIVANGTKTAVTLALASSMVALRTSGFINVTAATSGLADYIPCILSPHDNIDYLDLSSEP